ncbi:MAG: hypothetical protein ACMUIG_01145 [Thermoplasmatota archaeon]
MAAGGRILIHLLMQGGDDGPGGGKSSQEIISLHCGIGRTHVHRALKPLMSDDLIREEMGRLRGHIRKTKIYSLTEKGIKEAARHMEDARSISLTWQDENGAGRKDTVFDSARLINDVLGASGLPMITVPLLLSSDGEHLSWSEIIWLSNSLRKSGPDDRIPLPGWTLINPPGPPEVYLDREAEFRILSNMLDSAGTAVVRGEPGSGRRSLVGHYTRKKGLIPAWLCISDGDDEAALDPDSVDLLVVLDTTGPDPLSLLMDESDGFVRNIKTELPARIRELPLIVISELAGEVSNSRHITLTGLQEDVFIRSCVEIGLDPDLSKSLYRASKGSPSAISYLRSLNERDLGGIMKMEPEDAILGIILGMKREKTGINTESSQKID